MVLSRSAKTANTKQQNQRNSKNKVIKNLIKTIMTNSKSHLTEIQVKVIELTSPWDLVHNAKKATTTKSINPSKTLTVRLFFPFARSCKTFVFFLPKHYYNRANTSCASNKINYPHVHIHGQNPLWKQSDRISLQEQLFRPRTIDHLPLNTQISPFRIDFDYNESVRSFINFWHRDVTESLEIFKTKGLLLLLLLLLLSFCYCVSRSAIPPGCVDFIKIRNLLLRIRYGFTLRYCYSCGTVWWRHMGIGRLPEIFGGRGAFWREIQVNDRSFVV